MPNPIIPQRLEMLKRFFDIPRFWGPVLTIVFTVAYHHAALYFGFSVVTGWIWLLVIAGGFVGGLWASLLCATWSAAYTLYALGDDPSRQVQGIIIVYLMAVIVGYSKRQLRQTWELSKLNEAKAQALDELNGNLERLRLMHKEATDLILGWATLDDGARFGIVREIAHHLAHLVSITQGWHYLYKEREAIIEAGKKFETK